MNESVTVAQILAFSAACAAYRADRQYNSTRTASAVQLIEAWRTIDSGYVEAPFDDIDESAVSMLSAMLRDAKEIEWRHALETALDLAQVRLANKIIHAGDSVRPAEADEEAAQ